MIFSKRNKIEKKKLKKAVLLMLMIVLAGIVVDLVCQRDVLMLPAEEKGVFVIPTEQVETNDFEWTEQGWQLTEEDGNLIFWPNGKFVSRVSVSYDCDQRVNGTWRVWEKGEDQPRILEDSNSLLIDTTVMRLDMSVDQINIKLEKDYDSGELKEASELFVKEIRIINEYQINWYRILFVCFMLGLPAFLWMCRDWIVKYVAQAYMVVALSMGLLMIIMTPANKVSWDEEVHFFHAYCVSHFGTEVKTNDILEKLFVADEENWPYSLPENIDERIQMNETLNERVKEEEYFYSRGRSLAGIYTPAYVPSAVGIRLGLLCGMPFTMVYQWGRLANLVFSVVIMAWAIYKIPVGKAILAMIGLLPTSLFLMSMYSYDSFITVLFALGYAIFLDEYMHRDRKITWRSFWLMALAFAVGSMPKAIYIPLILVIWLLPKEKFVDRKQELWMKGIAAALFLALMASFVLPVIISPAESNDTRGGNTSEAGQIPYILSDIPRFIDMMVYSIRTTFVGYTIGSPVYGSLGHLGLEMLGKLLPMFALLVIFMDKKYLDDEEQLNGTTSILRLVWSTRLWTLLMCLAVIGMIWVAMYLAFTPVGYDHVNGVQPRYYIPLLLPIYLCLCPDRIRIRVKERWLYLITFGGCMGITMVVMAKAMLSLCV